MKKYLSQSIILVFLLCNGIFQAQQNEIVKAKIETNDIEGILNVKATADNNTKVYQTLSYQLLTVKEGEQGNLSSSQQSGKFTLQPNEKKQLSEASVAIRKNDALKIFLFIRDEKNNTISKDSLTYNMNKKIALSEKKNSKKKKYNFLD